MLTDSTLEAILGRIPTLKLGVLGDLFLDRYLDIDGSLTERSLETGLDAYQVVRVRPSPGAAGTVINNLVALGVGTVLPVAVIGDDGEGYELRQSLHRQRVDTAQVSACAGRRTPTYTKPMLQQPGAPPRELNRLDIKNRSRLPADAEEVVLRGLDEVWSAVDGLLVMDQVSEPDCGVVTTRVRERVAELGSAGPGKLILADSRERIGLFRSATVKPNRAECVKAVYGSDGQARLWREAAEQLARRSGRPVFCTLGDEGIFVTSPGPERGSTVLVRAFPVCGPTDIVGAGDSASAGIACALASGAPPAQAAAFGNLVASITVQQIGTTGTASPEQVRARWQQVRGAAQ